MLRLIHNGFRAFWLCAAVFAAAALSSAHADESASLVTFSTVGPDCYADGSQVLDGEYYALVYQTEAAGEVKFTLAGEIALDASEAQLLRALPLARLGRCPTTTFSVDESDLPKLSSCGVLRLYLLDTRVYENGVAVVGGLGSVQSSVPVTSNCKVTTQSAVGSECGAFAASILPEDALRPRISSLVVAGGVAELTVEDTIEGVNYVVDDPIAGVAYDFVAPVTGVDGEPVKIRIPCSNSKSLFFRVKRR